MFLFPIIKKITITNIFDKFGQLCIFITLVLIITYINESVLINMQHFHLFKHFNFTNKLEINGLIMYHVFTDSKNYKKGECL